ncbi:pyridoxamine 5'-phosphate oxidase family protein [Flavobacteriaceae bacterium]|nr:pyridoxamine 5'-phosphate oxidase family protein [Flavobacteriaceae bacterium]
MSEIDLRQLYGEPRELVREAYVPFLDETAQRFIRASRLMLISSCNDEGFMDISPRGGAAGFIRIIDKRTIEFLDMPGNKKILTLSNVKKNNKVGLMFVVSGTQELLRAYGTVELIEDEQKITDLGGDTSRNKILVRVNLKKIFPHCGKAMAASDLWNHETWHGDTSEKVPGLVDMAKSMAIARQQDDDK